MCLLGNNGSGKTTLINMLTGLLPADDNGGDAFLKVSPTQHISLKESLFPFRSYVRLCQQNDFLCEEMTTREHLQLVCKLRGITDPPSMEATVKEKALEVDVFGELDK